jgi:hypothetical protein
VVAHIDLVAGKAVAVLHFGGRDETELFAEPAPSGLLVVSRWAARDSDVLHVPVRGSAARLLPHAYGAYAHLVAPDRVIVYTQEPEEGALLVGLDAVLRDRTPLRGFVHASAGAADVAAFATESRLVVARREGDRLKLESIVFAPHFDVSTEPGRPLSEDERHQLGSDWSIAQRRAASCGMTTRGDGSQVITINQIPAAHVEAARAYLERLGFKIASVTQAET